MLLLSQILVAFIALLHPAREFRTQIEFFFLACVVLAGIYGAATVSRKIFWIQVLSAVRAALAVCFARGA